MADWRPATQPFITAIITFADHPEGTTYSAHVMHKDPADKSLHAELGFYDGWGTVVEQLAGMVEGRGVDVGKLCPSSSAHPLDLPNKIARTRSKRGR